MAGRRSAAAGSAWCRRRAARGGRAARPGPARPGPARDRRGCRPFSSPRQRRWSAGSSRCCLFWAGFFFFFCLSGLRRYLSEERRRGGPGARHLWRPGGARPRRPAAPPAASGLPGQPPQLCAGLCLSPSRRPEPRQRADWKRPASLTGVSLPCMLSACLPIVPASCSAGVIPLGDASGSECSAS